MTVFAEGKHKYVQLNKCDGRDYQTRAHRKVKRLVISDSQEAGRCRGGLSQMEGVLCL